VGVAECVDDLTQFLMSFQGAEPLHHSFNQQRLGVSQDAKTS